MTTRRLLAISTVLAVIVAASCERGSAPVSPATHSDALLANALGNISLLTCTPLPPDSTTVAIGPDGGVISAGPHRLVVPPGALDSVVNITAVVQSDTINSIRFLPSGLQFQRSARLHMSYANCGVLGALLPHSIAYIDESFNILDLLPSLDDVFTQRVSTGLHHFSDYAVAW
jgi:hypothetical protein